MHRSGRAQKMGNAWSHSSRVTSGGREVDVGGGGHNRKYVCAHALENGTQRSKRQISQ